MTKKKAIIVGAGGIGSWLCFHLFNLQQYEQLSNVAFTIADDDTVDIKNVSYQNFDETELLEAKVVALQDRYGFDIIADRITSLAQIEEFDLVVSAVDNTSFRRLIFNNIPDNDFYWIDLRSEGNQVSAYTKGADKQLMLNTVSVDAEDKSCQRQFELDQGIIHNGNKIIAAIGAQYVMNWNRGEMNKKAFNTVF